MMDIEKLAREALSEVHAVFLMDEDDEFCQSRAILHLCEAVRRETAEEAAKVCEEMRANESVAAAHYAGNFQQAFDYHLQRHAIIADVRDAIRERFKAS